MLTISRQCSITRPAANIHTGRQRGAAGRRSVDSAAPRHRRGVTTIVVAVALLVAMGCLSVILDQFWLDTTRLELTTAAEAAALAACQELASDQLLLEQADADNEQSAGDLLTISGADSGLESAGSSRIANARSAAIQAARWNQAAGLPVELRSSAGTAGLATADEDIRFGRLVEDTVAGNVRFIETTSDPAAVVVTAQRTRSRNNPVAIFVTGLAGLPYADVAARAEASLWSNVYGLRPLAGSPIPALPCAVLYRDAKGQRKDTWQRQIEQRLGPDEFTYNHSSGRIEKGSDGIHEIVLISQRATGTLDDVNWQLLDVGTGLNDERLADQIDRGFLEAELDAWGGEIDLPTSARPWSLAGTGQLTDANSRALEEIIGQPRLWWLYDSATPSGRRGQTNVAVSRLVAGRICDLRNEGDGRFRMVLQPTIMTTRTALVDQTASTPPTPMHTYVYNVQLTH